MGNEEFSLAAGDVKEASSGMLLQMIDNGTDNDQMPWISGWFQLPGGNLVIQKFMVADTGKPTYELIKKAVVFWGKLVLEAGQASSIEMSPEFGRRFLIPAILQQVWHIHAN
jgi:hypothetical protein